MENYTTKSTLINALLLFFITMVAPQVVQSQTPPPTSRDSLSAALKDTAQVVDDGQVNVDSTFLQTYINSQADFQPHLPLAQLFYRDRGYNLAWFKNNMLVPQAHKFVQAIQNARNEGLNPGDYKAQTLLTKFQEYERKPDDNLQKHQLQQEIDVALTASYFNYASDFYKGTVDPHNSSAIDWQVKRNKVKLNKALETILQERESTYPYYEFEALHEGYRKLRNALVQYRQIQQNGGWAQIEGQGVVKPNDTAKVVLALRKRLMQQQVRLPDSAFAFGQDTALYVYDQQVVEAVKEFQKRHGLTVDGVLGPQTYAALNVPVDDRIQQIVLNMERWRWLPKRLVPKGKPNRYVLVNIPGYRLSVMEEGKEAMRMKVVVGKTMHATPVFSHKIQYLMFSPYWNVPNSIVEAEIAPKLQRDQGWLERNNMEMVTTFGPGARRVPLNRVNWYTVTQESFEYRIRQRPGPDNSLGRVKFMFPNEQAIYLHDTPADHLFGQAERDFSHGCVRVERPADLATYLLQDLPDWDKNKVLKAMNSGVEQRVDLTESVPVYLVYFTAWVEEDGAVHFREDLYGHDQTLAQNFY